MWHFQPGSPGSSVRRDVSAYARRMTQWRRTTSAILLSVAVASSGVVVSSPANGAAGQCVTKKEYKKIRNGMTKSRVHNIFDTNGEVLFINPGHVHNEAYEYRTCRAFARTAGQKVQVQYNNYATRGGPVRVVYKQTY